jgi:ATP-dependent DNA helicase RecQ
LNSQTILKLLRDHWGYGEFRPKQEAIISAIIAGSDVAVVMPTGGGKSLCYQLPAVALGKTALVVSPLLSLMQDQVAQLKDFGIPAASLNSMLSQEEQSQVIRSARRGDYRLLYVSPERLAREDTLAWLRHIPLSFFAIDEAHCISEWGHEFRPEYRQLSRLRSEFPDLPIAAFTASATRRVRHDILDQLHLRSPRTSISSFFRPNLRYAVRACRNAEQEQLLIGVLAAHRRDSVIVYAPTIARVEETVDFLAGNGISALPYHGKMDGAARRRHQAQWMSDEVAVLVGTLAFGMGINKPSVRAVVHLSLPKSIEQYYQEAGRAGRDGLAADCVLLWRKQDAGLLAHFIEQIGDGAERERAWNRYHRVRRFAEAPQCRHKQICLYFGETPKWDTCGACDVCLGQPEWLAAHAGAAPQRLAARAGAGPRSAPDSGRTKKTIGAEASASEAGAAESRPADAELLEYLRQWRRDMAAARGVPAFVILHDTSLADLCRKRPGSAQQLETVYGIGRAKRESLGEALLSALAAFDSGARAQIREAPTTSPAEQTRAMLAEGMSFSEIASARGRRLNTVITQVADMVEKGTIEFDPKWVVEDVRNAIEQLALRLGTDRLKPIKEALPPEVDYPEIRLVVSALRKRGGNKSSPAS